MREGWELKKLEDLADEKKAIVSGPFGSNLKVSDYRDSGVPIIRLQNVGKGYFIEKDIKYIDKEKAEELKSHSFVVGDIVLAKLGIPIGKTCIIPESFGNGIILADIVRIRPDKKKVDYQFLEYFLNTNLSVSQLTKNISGATRPRVNLSNVRSIIVPIPPLPEQKQIVKTLDLAFKQIDQAKANLEKNLANTKELFASKLNEVFSQRGKGWVEKKLGDSSLLRIVDGDRGKNYPKKVDFLPEGYCVFLNTGNVRPNGFDFNNIMCITEEKDNLLRKGKLERDDVIMTTRGTIGNLGWYHSDVKYENIRINSGMLIFRVNKEKILPEFLFKLFQSPFMKKQIEERTTGAAQPQLPIKTLIDFILPIHSDLIVQKQMVSKIEELEEFQNKLQTHYQQNLNNLEELKKSILEKAFKGEL